MNPAVFAPPPPPRPAVPAVPEALMVTVAAARRALRCRGRDVFGWIASGDLEWAFDLRRARSRRPFIRILAGSVARARARGRCVTPRERARGRALRLDPVFDTLIGHHKSDLLARDLAAAWGCGPSHIHNLVADGLLPVKEKDYGLREAFQIPRRAALEFMKQRRMQ